MLDVYFFEAFAEEADWLRRLLPGRLRADFTWKTVQEAAFAEPPARLVSLRTQSTLPAAWRGKVDAVLSRTTGHDHIARNLRALGDEVPCGYLPLYCSRAVAEQALLLWLALLRKLPQQIANFPRFDRNGLTGSECAGKTLVVVGVGNIGAQVVRIGLGLGMRAIGVDLVPKHDWVRYADSEEALPQADVVVCCMNLTSENAGYYDEARLRQMRAGAVFVNVARGELSPSSALLAVLEAGHLGAAALDVYDHESELAVALRAGRESADGEVRAALALARHPRAILTPHNAFNTVEAVERKAAQAVQQVEAFLQTGAFVWPVPREAADPGRAEAGPRSHPASRPTNGEGEA